jgi:hypothetical protein
LIFVTYVYRDLAGWPVPNRPHYKGWRPHRGRLLYLSAAIKRRPVLGGLINEYERVASIPRSGAMAEIGIP